MQLYDGTVRLSGSVLNEVPKTEMTAAEVLLLVNIHGSGSVVRLIRRKMDKRNHSDERERLGKKYGERRVVALFGTNMQKLPIELEGIDSREPSDDELTDEELNAMTAPELSSDDDGVSGPENSEEQAWPGTGNSSN
ncbi:MAG: hypothetical protein ABJP25_02785 [Sneathiella sp.]